VDQFEYKRLFYRVGVSGYGWHDSDGGVVGNPQNNDIFQDLEDILQELGRQGWELAGIFSSMPVQVFLKRRKRP
jgi:hypothetical protein